MQKYNNKSFKNLFILNKNPQNNLQLFSLPEQPFHAPVVFSV